MYTVGGKWHHTGEQWTHWTDGFLGGMMWQFHLRTGDQPWRARAEHYSKLLEHRQLVMVKDVSLPNFEAFLAKSRAL
jgi:unsaturated chondroitin disaccharide hydrolase